MDRILHMPSALLAGDHVSLQSVTYISELLFSTRLLYECYFVRMSYIVPGVYKLSAARCTLLLHVSKRYQPKLLYVLYCHIG